MRKTVSLLFLLPLAFCCLSCASSKVVEPAAEDVVAAAEPAQGSERIRDEDVVITHDPDTYDSKKRRCEHYVPIGTRIGEIECTTEAQREQRRKSARELIKKTR